ncbi:hypothetical protein [Deinococcus hopiensis]|nr:hypothetical protein [Deinococcus hopiensis]
MINAADRDWVVALGACRTLQAAGGTVEDVLLFLRRAGFWKMDSIRALRELEGMTLGEAKIAVHAGPTWSDRYEMDEALHDQVEAALDSFGKETQSNEGKKE